MHVINVEKTSLGDFLMKNMQIGAIYEQKMIILEKRMGKYKKKVFLFLTDVDVLIIHR